MSFKVILGKARNLSAEVKGEVLRCRRPELLAVTCLCATVPDAFTGKMSSKVVLGKARDL